VPVPETRHAKEMNKSYDSIFWVKASMELFFLFNFHFLQDSQISSYQPAIAKGGWFWNH
jgi:hypothetical protein